MKNLYNYEKVISGEVESNCAKNTHKGEAVTFDYNVNKYDAGDRNAATYSSEWNVEELIYDWHKSSCKSLQLHSLGQNIKEIPVIVDMKKAVKGSNRRK